MPILRDFILLLHHNQFFSSILAGLIGEEAVLFLAFLSGSEHIIPIWIIFISSIVGIILMDHLWYFIGKYELIQNFWNSKKIEDKYYHFSNSVKGLISGKYLAKLIISKFIYGTRIVTLTYTSSKISYKKYLLYDSAAVLIWTSIMVPLAWLAGRGLFISFRFIKGFEKSLAFALLFVIFFFIISKIISNKLLGKNKHLSKRVAVQIQDEQ